MIILKNKRIELNFSLFKGFSQVFGIGSFFSQEFVKRLGFNIYNKKICLIEELTVEQIELVFFWVSFLLLERELLRTVYLNISKLQDIKTYRGLRHRVGLPQKGRTHTNASSCKRVFTIYQKRFKSIL